MRDTPRLRVHGALSHRRVTRLLVPQSRRCRPLSLSSSSDAAGFEAELAEAEALIRSISQVCQ